MKMYVVFGSFDLLINLFCADNFFFVATLSCFIFIVLKIENELILSFYT